MLSDIIFILTRYGPLLLEGLRNTLLLTCISYIIGLVLGLGLSILRVYGPLWVKAIVATYTEIFRGTPMVVQLFLIYYSLPSIGVKLDPFTSAIIAIGLNSGAYQAEYFRSAIGSVSLGQWEAALSIGMKKATVIRTIIIPQVFRVALPALTNEIIYLLKYSSIAYFITVPELVYTGKIIGTRTFMYLQVYTVIAIIYVIFSLLFSELFFRVEKRISIPGISISTTLRQ